MSKNKSPNLHNQHIVMGCHTIEGLVKHTPDRLIKAYHLKSSDNSQERKQKLISDLQNLNIPMQACSKAELDRLCDSSSHQGIVAALKNREPVDLKTFIDKNETKLVVVLDSIYDPHNLGAILRASECFGVGLIIWSKNRSAPLSPVVTKTSSSASEFAPIHIVSNVSTTLDKFVKAGYTLVGAQISDDSQNLFNYKFPDRCVLVLGSEGEGIRALLQKKLDASVAIPMHGKIDSLNVSQAAALCIGVWSSQQA